MIDFDLASRALKSVIGEMGLTRPCVYAKQPSWRERIVFGNEILRCGLKGSLVDASEGKYGDVFCLKAPTRCTVWQREYPALTEALGLEGRLLDNPVVILEGVVREVRSNRDAFEVLGVSREATMAEIREAARKKRNLAVLVNDNRAIEEIDRAYWKIGTDVGTRLNYVRAIR